MLMSKPMLAGPWRFYLSSEYIPHGITVYTAV